MNQPPSVSLSTLFTDLGVMTPDHDCEITGLALDSRLVKAGDLFFALRGKTHDGRAFIQDAIARGAVGVVSEEPLALSSPIPVIVCEDLAQNIGVIASRFYGDPSQHMAVVGITGTNGKTSCSHFIAQALEQQGIRCGIMGTIGVGFYGELSPSLLTTPDPITTQQHFHTLLEKGASVVAMEVSSHALAQGRVRGTQFTVGVFTNLSQDHLDYHTTMESYAEAKLRLFKDYELKTAVVNADDPLSERIMAALSPQTACVTYSLKNKRFDNMPSLTVDSILHEHSLSKVRLSSSWGGGEFETRLLGEFNISNLLAVLATLCAMAISWETALTLLTTIQSIAGRMQPLGGGEKPLVVIDYSHTPDALQKALATLREHTPGRLICVFGCGGDRDQDKRAMMGEIAERFSDRVYVTNDNPRSEDPEVIADAILQGMKQPNKITRELNRDVAIAQAIQSAGSGDTLLIAGKGHENYQILADQRIPFSDLTEAKKWL